MKQFNTFKNKSNAFNHTGINSELAQMIKKWHLPGQLLAVGKQEHKTIIEQKLVSIVSLLCLYP
jgi:nucleolar protein 58